jgi:hypothetical protein
MRWHGILGGASHEKVVLIIGAAQEGNSYFTNGLNKFLRTRGPTKKGAVLLCGALLEVGLQTQGGRVTKQKPVLADQEIHKVLFAGLPADCIADNQDQRAVPSETTRSLSESLCLGQKLKGQKND